jgi:hypothetical protein
MTARARIEPRAAAPTVARATDLLRRRAIVAATLPVVAVVAWGALIAAESRFGLLRAHVVSPWLFAGLFVGTALHLAAACFQRRDRSGLVRVHGTSAGLCVVLATLSGATLLAVPALAAVSMALGALGIAAATEARDRVARAVRSRALPEEADDVPRRRARSAAWLLVPAMIAALLLARVVTWTPGVADPGGNGGRGDRQSGTSSEGSDGSAGNSGGGIIVDPSAPGAKSPWVSHDVLIEVTPRHDAEITGRVGALYLRGTVLDRVDESGRWLESAAAPGRLRDADDGVRDGWCTIAPRPPRTDELTLDVRQATMAHGASGGCVLHAPSSVSAVERDEILHVRDGVLLDELPDADHITYALLWTLPGRLAEPTDRTRFARSATSPTDLPRGGRIAGAVEALVREAEAVTSGSTTDLAIVRAICNHLRGEYRYEKIEGTDAGASALGVFVDDRRGTCVQFAEAACVMLRSRGVPARIASGFLVREWVASRSTYVGRGTDYHAWIEVPFAGCGWVPFDPTPLDATAVQESPDDDAGLGGSMDSIADSIDEAVGSLVDLVRAHPWLLIISVLGVAWLLRRLSRAQSADDAAEADDDPPIPCPAWDRLLAALSARGLHRGSAQTAREFAAVVFATLGAPAASFTDLTERQQAARFGRIAVAPADEASMDALADSLGG